MYVDIKVQVIERVDQHITSKRPLDLKTSLLVTAPFITDLKLIKNYNF